VRRLRCEWCKLIFEVAEGRRERFCSPTCRHAVNGSDPDWATVEKSATAAEWRR
jgi:rubredoxin